MIKMPSCYTCVIFTRKHLRHTSTPFPELFWTKPCVYVLCSTCKVNATFRNIYAVHLFEACLISLMRLGHVGVTVHSQISCNQACTGSSIQLRLYPSRSSLQLYIGLLLPRKAGLCGSSGIDHCIHNRQSWDSLEFWKSQINGAIALHLVSFSCCKKDIWVI